MRRIIFVSLALAAIGIAIALRTAAGRTTTLVSVQAPSNQPVVQALSAVPKKTTASEFFLVRAQNGTMAYDMSNGRLQFTLPPGMLSADGKHYFAAMKIGADTKVNDFDLTTGGDRLCAKIEGRWALSGVSSQGRWIALTEMNESKTDTNVKIVDTTNGDVVHSLHLDGNFEVETVAANGDALFLIQHLSADRYLVQSYQFPKRALVTLRAKTATDEVMTGYAWQGLASSDGRWLLTLYLNMQRNSAFIHTLDLANQYPVCIDVPSGDGDVNKLKAYTLALAPDNQTLYAINPALGVVAVIDLNERRVIRKTDFAAAESRNSHSVVSQDGSRVYWSSGEQVLAFDARGSQVRGLYHADAQIKALGLAADGKRLFAATDGGAILIDAVSGAQLDFTAASLR